MILVSGNETDDHLGLIDDVIPAGHAGPALHVHARFDEGFYVLDGIILFQLGERVFDVGPGGVALARRGVPHTFANRTDRDVRVLVFVTPAGFERYFADGAANARPPAEETVVVGAALGA